jgi:chromatin segregation and condensation protein Rec8/ScpA/Scc1 (kleisin family)
MDFRVELDTFRGPLDLLLYLVRKHEVDVADIPIALITDQYIAHLEVLQQLDVNAVGDFLDLASTLIEIKSQMVLPRGGEESQEWDDPRDELVARLLEYKQYKDAASLLDERSRDWQQHYPRLASDLPPRHVDPAGQPIHEVELWDLVSALGRILRDNQAAERAGIALVEESMEEALRYAERRTRACIARFPDGTYRASDVLEDDARGEPRDVTIRVTVRVHGDELHVDFGGTDSQVAGNLNCPLSVAKSAVFFVVRVLTDPDIPASAGAYRPIRVAASPGSLVNARPPAAVAGGNVETSSRIADAVMLAMASAVEAPALGQGTMNNLTLGNDSFTYYETMGGGQGACPNADGPSGVHVAMSNTLNTPVEALEVEFPLRVCRYELRRGTGGGGRFRGGDGLLRELEALAGMEFSLLSERRRHRPAGARGGAPGAPGRNRLLVAGAERELPAKASGSLPVGARLRIESPGGGGFGQISASQREKPSTD